MSITINKPGWQTQVMDQGRKMTRHLGIPASGVIDLFQYWWANGLTGQYDFKGSGPPVLEIRSGPPVEITFETGHAFAITGSPGEFSLDGLKLKSHRMIRATKNQVLRIASIQPNGTVYLAIAGEWKVDRVYGSASMDMLTPFPGTCGRRLQKEDRLEILPPSTEDLNGIETPTYIRQFQYNFRSVLRLTAGPEIGMNDLIKKSLFEDSFLITPQSNRMAYRLESKRKAPPILPSMLSVFVLPGMIQWPAGGHPMLLLPNCQVTGGYPRVARVIDADMWKLAYCGPGDRIHFKWTTMDEALYLREYRIGQFTQAWQEVFPRPITGHSLLY